MKHVSQRQLDWAINTLKTLNDIPHEKRIQLDSRLNYVNYDWAIEGLEAVKARMVKESARVGRKMARARCV